MKWTKQMKRMIIVWDVIWNFLTLSACLLNWILYLVHVLNFICCFFLLSFFVLCCCCCCSFSHTLPPTLYIFIYVVLYFILFSVCVFCFSLFFLFSFQFCYLLLAFFWFLTNSEWICNMCLQCALEYVSLCINVG